MPEHGKVTPIGGSVKTAPRCGFQPASPPPHLTTSPPSPCRRSDRGFCLQAMRIFLCTIDPNAVNEPQVNITPEYLRNEVQAVNRAKDEAAYSVINLGKRLCELKEACRHGEFVALAGGVVG